MEERLDYKSINKASWNARTDVHFNSEFYDNKSFIEGRNSLNEIELELLGDVRGKKVLHLQCHFGQDTISLARLGAIVTGVDISDRAIVKAHELAGQCGVQCRFVCADVYGSTNFIEDKFDIVFTSYGTIGWLPDLDQWANTISHFMKPQASFVFAEFHPFLWMFDDDFHEIKYKYQSPTPFVEDSEGTYTDGGESLQGGTVSWNHGISDVLGSLLKHGIEIVSFDEFDYSPYDCFNHTVEYQPGKFRIKHFEDRVPMVYSLKGIKKEKYED